jgi:tripartite ATP-independent transporter DctP family solute receptor
MTTRRRILAGAAAATIARPFASRADPVTTLRISTSAPPSDFLPRSLEGFKNAVEAGDNSLKVQVFPASTLFTQNTEVAAMQRGTLEMSTMNTFEVAQQMPELGFFNRAYLFKDYGHLRRVFDGPLGADYRAAVADKMGIVILASSYLGTRQANLRQVRKVATPDDMAGVKMRMPSGPEWLLLGRTIGVSPVPLGMPEVYLALKTGTIDGQENPLTIMSAAKLYEVTQQVVLTAHMLQPIFINIAKPVWDRLTPAQQALVQRAATEAGKVNQEGRLADEQSVAANLKTRGLQVDAIDLGPFRALADKVYAGSDLAKAWNEAWLKRVEAAV